MQATFSSFWLLKQKVFARWRCGDPLLGEVLAGHPERLQLGGLEHTAAWDVAS